MWVAWQSGHRRWTLDQRLSGVVAPGASGVEPSGQLAVSPPRDCTGSEWSVSPNSIGGRDECLELKWVTGEEGEMEDKTGRRSGDRMRWEE